MQITEVHLFPAGKLANDRILGYAGITLDHCFAVRDIRLVRKTDGGIIVALPDKKGCDRCDCGWKNCLDANYCNGCGKELPEGEEMYYRNIAYPITREFRRTLDDAVLAAWDRDRAFAEAAGEAS